MSEWFETCEGLYGEVWNTIVQGLASASHPARTPTFATVSPAGWPEARTVVLRAADTEAATVAIYTDIYSEKIRSLRASPRASLHIWAPQSALQIRLHTTVEIATGDAVLAAWNQLSESSRENYGILPSPGQPIDHSLDYAKSPDFSCFAVLNCRVATIDVVHLGDVHRRVVFSRSDEWAGRWLSP